MVWVIQRLASLRGRLIVGVAQLWLVSPFATMATMDVYGFADVDLKTARSAIESALSIRLEEAREEDGAGYYFRGAVPSGPWLQIRSNSGTSLRWHGDPSHPWHSAYRVLVFVHGRAPESIAECLRHSIPGLSFLETKETM
jgi:hypothetical protein